jgi:hypothetical protein
MIHPYHSRRGESSGGASQAARTRKLAVDRNVEHTLARVVDLDVRVAVLTVLDHAPLTEQRVRLVEEEDRASLLRSVEEVQRPQTERLVEVDLGRLLARREVIPTFLALSRPLIPPRRPSELRRLTSGGDRRMIAAASREARNGRASD